MIHIPVLRRGEVYDSLDRVELKNVRTGQPVAKVGQANAGMIRRDTRRLSRDCLKALPVKRLLDICREAGRLFMEEALPMPDGSVQSPATYIESLSDTCGLPHALVRRNMAKIHQVFTQMPSILHGLTRGLAPEVIETGSGEQAGVPVSFCPVADALGVALPSNSPGVNSLWMPAIPLRIPVVLKPGRDDPWTPWRIIRAFIAAGCPPDAFGFYPTDHEGSAAILESCGRSLIFGDENTVARYAGNPAIQVHGPGRSKILIGEDRIDRWPEFLEIMAQSVADNGGRSCINTSAIVVPSRGEEIAAALAEKLAAIRPLPAADDGAVLAGFTNPHVAESIDSAIESGLKVEGAVDVTARYRTGPRRAALEGSEYLLPTLVRCRSFDHPLANREFLFPYVSLLEASQEAMPELIGPSLVVTVLTQDRAFIDRLIACPRIDRLNIGPLPTTAVRWDQPHEGNLFDFLYRRRAIQREPFI